MWLQIWNPLNSKLAGIKRKWKSCLLVEAITVTLQIWNWLLYFVALKWHFDCNGNISENIHRGYKHKTKWNLTIRGVLCYAWYKFVLREDKQIRWEMLCFPLCLSLSLFLPTHLSPIQISQFPSGKNVLSDAAARPQKCILPFWLHLGKSERSIQQLLLIEGPLISHFHLKGAMRRGRKRQFHFRPKSNDYWSKKKRLPSISMGPGSGPLIFIPRLTTYEEETPPPPATIQAFSTRSFHSLQRAHQNLLVYVAFEFAS